MENSGNSLQATALVHEAYLRLTCGREQRWNSRGHFFGAAAEAMRRILIDRARRRQTAKRGGGRRRIEIDDAEALHCRLECADRIDLSYPDRCAEALERLCAALANITITTYHSDFTCDHHIRCAFNPVN